MGPISAAAPPLSSTRTPSVPATSDVYVASYRPAVAFHAAVAFAAAIAVTFPLSHVASEPPVTIAASTLTVKPGSSSASALP